MIDLLMGEARREQDILNPQEMASAYRHRNRTRKKKMPPLNAGNKENIKCITHDGFRHKPIPRATIWPQTKQHEKRKNENDREKHVATICLR